jgi:hypothetical protein
MSPTTRKSNGPTCLLKNKYGVNPRINGLIGGGEGVSDIAECLLNSVCMKPKFVK